MAGMRYQPQGGLRINTANALARDLSIVFVPGSSEYPSGRNLTPVGIGATFSASMISLPQNQRTKVSLGQRTLFVLATAPNTADFRSVVGVGWATSWPADASRHLAINKTNAGKWRVQSANGSAMVQVVSTASVRGTPEAIAAVNDGSQLIGYANGVPFGSVTQNGGVPVVNNFNIGGIGSAEYWTGEIYLVAYFNRALSPAEIATLSANPWELFAGPSDDGPTLYQMLASAGSYALSAGAAGLRAARRMPATVSSLTVSPGSAGLRVARKMAAAVGSLAVAAGAASLRAARKVTATAGTYALGAGIAGLYAARRIQATVASLNLFGGSVGLLAARRMPTSAASYSVTGSPVLLRVGKRMTADSAAYLIAPGSAGLLLSRRMPASGDALTLNASPAAFTYQRMQYMLVASPASFVLAANDILLNHQGKFIDATLIPAHRIINFEGSKRVVSFGGGHRVVPFEGGHRVVTFEGGHRVVTFEG